MIALAALHALAVATLAGVVARLAEELARGWGRATRWIWAAAIAASVGLGLAVAADAGGRLRAHAAASPLDRAALLAWALLSAFLAGVVVHAALEGRRLRHGLEARVVGGVPVLVTEHVGPAAVGARRPSILLPRWALDLDAALLDLVVRHEREHLRARDPLLLLAGLAAIVLVPWLLPVWWAWHRLRLAAEVDCDARVLRARPDVRRYGQLLLLTSQRAARTPWASRAVVTAATPLRPHASHLTERIQAMTHRPTPRSVRRTALLLGGIAATATAALALPSPATPAPSARAIVRLTEVGVHGAALAGDGLAEPILVHGTGAPRVGIGGAEPVPLTDTLRLHRLPAITADVTDGEVHVELTGGGEISVGGTITGGAAARVGARGARVVLLRGGAGVVPHPAR